VCRNCACSPQTARTTRAGLPVVASVFGQPFDSQCDRCCFVETLAYPSCPINPATNQQRQALMISTATTIQVCKQCTPMLVCIMCRHWAYNRQATTLAVAHSLPVNRVTRACLINQTLCICAAQRGQHSYQLCNRRSQLKCHSFLIVSGAHL
jgi:hypothetical protein